MLLRAGRNQEALDTFKKDPEWINAWPLKQLLTTGWDKPPLHMNGSTEPTSMFVRIWMMHWPGPGSPNLVGFPGGTTGC